MTHRPFNPPTPIAPTPAPAPAAAGTLKFGEAEEAARTAIVAERLARHGLLLKFKEPFFFTVTAPDGTPVWSGTKGLHAIRAMVAGLEWVEKQRAKGGVR